MIYDQIDWGVVKMKHISWRMRFRSMLNNGSGSLEEVQVKDHHECEMGKWLYSIGFDRYGKEPMFKVLDDSHRMVHRLASKCYTEFSNGQTIEALQSMNDVIKESDKLMELIDEFKIRIESKNEEKRKLSTHPHSFMV